jgi:hypothetical protein
MSLKPSQLEPGEHVLELMISAPASAEPTPTPVDQVPTYIYVDESLSQNELEAAVHALTETINRSTWQSQIQLLSQKIDFLTPLASLQIKSMDEALATALENAPSNLIILTHNSPSKEFSKAALKASDFFTRVNLVTPGHYIQVTDALCDLIANLKPKTLVNLKIEIQLPSKTDSLEPLEYIPEFTKSGSTHFANLIDLASEEVKVYAFKTSASDLNVRFEYEDLLLARRVEGGQWLSGPTKPR